MIKRDQIDKRFLTYRASPLTSAERRALRGLDQARRRAYLARREERQIATGDAIGRISIPRIGASYLVVQGTEEASPEKGPGDYPVTALPGRGRTVAIAGHRTTYLPPFRHIDALRRGDRIVLQMPYGRFVYLVQYHQVVSPRAWWITRNVGYERLVLSACDPLFSASHRIVVFASLA